MSFRHRNPGPFFGRKNCVIGGCRLRSIHGSSGCEVHAPELRARRELKRSLTTVAYQIRYYREVYAKRLGYTKKNRRAAALNRLRGLIEQAMGAGLTMADKPVATAIRVLNNETQLRAAA